MSTTCKPALPTLDEIPLLEEGARDWEEMLWMTMIPPEDTALRAAAIDLFKKSEDGANKIGGGPELTSELLHLSSIPTKTPGALAWKLAMALRYFQNDEEDWNWASYLLKSALVDALDHERARRSPTPISAKTKITEAYRQWAENWFGRYPTDEESNAAYAARQPLEETIVKTPSTSFADVAAKLRFIHAMTDHSHWVASRDVLDEAIKELERLASS